MGFNYNQAEKWFNPKVLIPIHLLSTTSRLESNWRFWHTYICFLANHRITEVTLMWMLLGQQVLDMLYFRHYCYFYDRLLAIVKYTIQKKSLMIIKSTSGLKWWHCWGTTPTSHYQTFFTEHTEAATFAWMLDISQLKNVLKTSTWIFLPVVTQYVRQYF